MGRTSLIIMASTLHVLLAAAIFGVTAAVPLYTSPYTSGASDAPEPSSTYTSSSSIGNSDDGYGCGGGAFAAGIVFLIVLLCCCCCCIKKMMCGGCSHGRCRSAHQGQRDSSGWCTCRFLYCKDQRRSAGQGWSRSSASEPYWYCPW